LIDNVLNNPNDVSVSIGFNGNSGSNSNFAVAVENVLAVNGMNTLTNQVSGVSFTVTPIFFSGSATSGHLGSINAGAYGAGTFVVAASHVNSEKYVWVAIRYSANGQSKQWQGCFALSSSAVTTTREVEASDSDSKVARDSYINLSATSFSNVDSVPTWNNCPVSTYTTKVYNVTYTATESTGNVVIGYSPNGHYYSSINAGASGSPAGTINFDTGYNYDVPSANVYTIVVTATYKLSGNPTLQSTYVNVPLFVYPSSKRSAQVQSTEVATVRADYAIGIASAGVMVAAVAIIAAVVIVRRKPQAATQF